MNNITFVMPNEIFNEVRLYFATLADWPDFACVTPLQQQHAQQLTSGRDSSPPLNLSVCVVCGEKAILTASRFFYCGHVKCGNCIKTDVVNKYSTSFDCNTCGKKQDEWIRDQPPGKMRILFSSFDLPGYNQCGRISVTFSIPTGFQRVSVNLIKYNFGNCRI